MVAMESGPVFAEPEPAPEPARAPGIDRKGMGYVWNLPHLSVRLAAEYLRERGDELWGEVTVESTLPGVASHLHQARINLSTTRTRRELAQHLAGLTPNDRIPWAQVIERFCVGVQRKARMGDPLVMVGRLPGNGRTQDQIDRLLPSGKPTIWYGPQGSGKGWMATAACACVATGMPLAGLRVRQGNVLYLDWEDSPETLNERVQVIAAGMRLPAAPEIGYRKCRKTLVRDLTPISQMAADLDAALIVVDSVGLAAGSAGSGGSYEDVALSFFEALRHLEPATVLCIDHVAGGDLKSEKLAGKAFGSVYKMAEARCAWELRADQDAGAAETHLGFYHVKHNHSVKYPAIGFKVEFAETEPGETPAYVRISREDVRDSLSLSKSLPLPDQIAGALRRGPLAVRAIADETELDADAVRTTLNRGKGKRFVKLPDDRWGVVAHNEAPDRPHLRPVPDAPHAASAAAAGETWPRTGD